MSDLRWKVAATVEELATLPDGIESRLEKAFARHLFGRDFYRTEDEELHEEVDRLIRRLIASRQKNSTYASRVRAMGIATDVCNLASRFPVSDE